MCTLLLLLDRTPLAWWWIALAAIAVGLLWELSNYYLVRKDFGSRKNEVRYDWLDVVPFGAAILIYVIFHFFIKK